MGSRGGRRPPSGGITRRRFLQEMGMAGGAAAVLSSMEVLGLATPAAATKLDFRAPSRSDFALQGRANRTKVVVLGAGVAGLCAAYELEKAGYEVEVLEARERPGGRNWTVRRGTTETDLDGVTQTCRFDRGEDQYLNVGPARIAQHHTTLDYCRELGVPIEVFAGANAHGWYYNEPSDTVSGGLAGRRVRHRDARADAYGYISELLAKAVNQGALDAELTAADKEALIELLRSLGFLFPNDDGDLTYFGGRNSYPSDDEPGAGFQFGTPIDPASMSDLLASRLGGYFEFEAYWDQAMLMYQPVGGMDRIPYAFEAALRRRPTYGAVVTDIARGPSGVTVTCRRRDRTRTATGDYCICTIPPLILKDIPNDFGAQVNADLATPLPVSIGKLGLQYGRRWWEEDEAIFGGITYTNMDIGTIWYPSHGFLGRKGVLLGFYYGGEVADRWAAMTPAQREAQALEEGARIHGPVYRDEFRDASFSAFWQKTRFSEAGWVFWPDGNFDPDSAYGRLLEPVGTVYFAGDHLAQVSAWQHGAFESARLAVSRLHERVLAAG